MNNNVWDSYAINGIREETKCLRMAYTKVSPALQRRASFYPPRGEYRLMFSPVNIQISGDLESVAGLELDAASWGLWKVERLYHSEWGRALDLLCAYNEFLDLNVSVEFVDNNIYKQLYQKLFGPWRRKDPRSLPEGPGLPSEPVLATDQADLTLRTRPSSEVLPWTLPSSEVKVVDGYEAEVVGEVGDEYLVEYADGDAGVVEARLPKSDLQALPHPVRIGTCFGIVLYRRAGAQGITVSAWPVAKYWHQSLQSDEPGLL